MCVCACFEFFVRMMIDKSAKVNKRLSEKKKTNVNKRMCSHLTVIRISKETRPCVYSDESTTEFWITQKGSLSCLTFCDQFKISSHPSLTIVVNTFAMGQFGSVFIWFSSIFIHTRLPQPIKLNVFSKWKSPLSPALLAPFFIRKFGPKSVLKETGKWFCCLNLKCRVNPLLWHTKCLLSDDAEIKEDGSVQNISRKTGSTHLPHANEIFARRF